MPWIVYKIHNINYVHNSCKKEAGYKTNFFFTYSTTASAISSAVIPAK